MQSQNAVSLPTFEIEVSKLPSRGVPYPAGSIVKYRTYSHGEIRQFSTQAPSIATSLEMAMQGIETVGFDKLSLTIIDALYIGLSMKVNTQNGLQMEVPFQCESCGKVSTKIFNQSDIEFSELKEEITDLPLIATLGNREFHFAPMTVKSFLDMERGRYDRYTKNNKIDAIAVEALMVTNMDFEQAYNVLYNLSDDEDTLTLAEIDEMLLYDLKPIKAICTQELDDKKVCNHANFVKLEGREALIKPFRGGERTPRTRIRIGNK